MYECGSRSVYFVLVSVSVQRSSSEDVNLRLSNGKPKRKCEHSAAQCVGSNKIVIVNFRFRIIFFLLWFLLCGACIIDSSIVIGGRAQIQLNDSATGALMTANCFVVSLLAIADKTINI